VKKWIFNKPRAYPYFNVSRKGSFSFVFYFFLSFCYQPCTDSPGQPGQDSKQDSRSMTVRTGQLGQGIWEYREGLNDRNMAAGTDGQKCRGGTRMLGRDGWITIAGTEHLGQDCRGGSTGPE
jgi:hypothetical protein